MLCFRFFANWDGHTQTCDCVIFISQPCDDKQSLKVTINEMSVKHFYETVWKMIDWICYTLVLSLRSNSFEK